MKKIYVPFDDKTGWFVHNNIREEVIHLKLSECENLKSGVLPVCAEPTVVPAEPKFYQHPLFLMTISSFALVLGYGFGMDRARH